MSLIYNASPYVSSGANKTKRQSTIGKPKKTIKNTTAVVSNDDVDENIPMYPGTQNFLRDSEPEISENFKETIDSTESRAEKINALLNRITGTNSGDGLADYKPAKDTQPDKQKYLASELLPKTEGFTSGEKPGVPTYLPSQNDVATISNYNLAYDNRILSADYSPTSGNKPYYSVGKNGGGDTMMEKLNYITHMLEEIQYEKTSNITEELILYSFLGIFVIFVVDSFSRGKIRYTR